MKKIILALTMVASMAVIAVPAALAGDENHPNPHPPAVTQFYANCIKLPAALPSPAGSYEVDNDLAADIAKNAGGKFYIGQLQIGPPGPSLIVTAGDPNAFLVPGSWIEYNLATTPCVAGTPPVFMALPVRGLYCAAVGNTHPFTGAAIPLGWSLDLLAGQPGLKGSTYVNATPANYVEGKGLTCDPPPAGYVRKGTAGDAQHVSSEPGYPLWVKG